MRYFLVPFLFLFALTGCDSDSDSIEAESSVSTETGAENSTSTETEIETETENQASTETENSTSTETEDPATTDTVNYSEIKCEDDLSAVINLINEIRSQAQVCGTTSYPAVDNLTSNNLLTIAAQTHSDDMANNNFFSHTGSDGSTLGERINLQGYQANAWGENIAAGQQSAESVVGGWMNSEGHCKNIMNENFTEMGLACTANSNTDYPTYWTQDFGKPVN